MFQQRIEHSKTADAIYVYLTDAKVAYTKELDDLRNIDYDATRGVVGIEFLGVSHGIDLRGIPFRPTVERLLEGYDFPIYA
ncbi:MAG: DUF2283 domain-containing protein [Dehalococcoidia bacterium]